MEEGEAEEEETEKTVNSSHKNNMSNKKNNNTKWYHTMNLERALRIIILNSLALLTILILHNSREMMIKRIP